MLLTTNLGLKKPELTDYVNVEDFNENADKLDVAINTIQTGTQNITSLETTSKTLAGAINEINTKKVEKIVGKGLSTNDYTTTEKTKLTGIATGANNYTHPTTHPASMITTDEVGVSVQSKLTSINTQMGDKANNVDTNRFTLAKDVTGAVNELFTNVSNGKQLVGTAITGVDNSVTIPTEPSFNDLATAIGNISTGKKWASGEHNFLASGSTIISITGFIPNVIIISAPFGGKPTTLYIRDWEYSTLVNINSSSYNYNSFVIENVTNNSFNIRQSFGAIGIVNWIAFE